SIHEVNRGTEVSGVIVHEANKAQRRESTFGVVGIELPLPLRVTVIIRKVVVETAVVRIGVRGKGNVRGVGHDRWRRNGSGRVVCQGNGACDREVVIAGYVHKETIVAKRATRP